MGTKNNERSLKNARTDYTPSVDMIATAFSEIVPAEHITAFALLLRDATSRVFNDHPKWCYLHKHARRRRTRKKYRNLLVRQILKALKTAELLKEEDE